MKEKQMNSRIQQKIDIEANWAKATFAPLKGELIIYAPDENHDYPRLKIGDGVTPVGGLSFYSIEKVDKTYFDEISNTYLLDIDYTQLLAFDTSEIVFSSNVNSILGQAILGQLILA